MRTEEAVARDATVPAMLDRWAELGPRQRIGHLAAPEVSEQVRRLAAALAGAAAQAVPGLDRRPVIAYETPPGVDGALLFLAAATAGVAAPLRPGMTPSEEQGAVALLAPDIYLPAEAGRIEQLIASGGDTIDPPVSGDLALMLTTSGTTGPAKRVGLDHARLSLSAHQIADWFELSADDHALTVMPLFHIHGLVAGILAPLAGGGSVSPTPFDAFGFGTTVAEVQPTWCSAVPSMWELILRRWRERTEELRDAPWRFLRTSSSALPPSLMVELEAAFGVPVLEAYGMTEAAHQITANPLPPRRAVGASVGFPTGQIDVRIVEPDSSGEGPIQIKGPTIIDRYLDGQAPESFDDGWFSTGDQGLLDAEGRLFITGRISEFINRGGDKISPHEIEQALAKHPQVDRAVAFPMPHDVLGQVPGAAVVLRPDADADVASLQRHLAEQLSRAKRPARLEIVSDWPLGPTGKLQRRFLVDQLGWV